MRLQRPLPLPATLLALLLSSFSHRAATLRSFDASFAPRFQATMNYFPPGSGTITQPFGEVYEFDFQSDGKIVVVGGFDAVNSVPASNIARLNPDGSTDAAFTSKIHLNGSVTSVTIDAQGRILITGYFNTINNVSLPGVARLLSSGDLDPTFTPNFTILGGADGVRRLPGGGYLLFGTSFKLPTAIDGDEIVRISEDGLFDTNYKLRLFGAGVGSKSGHDNLRAAIQPDGKLLLGGPLFTEDADFVSVMRFMPNGSVDTSFNTISFLDLPEMDDLALLPDGRFLTAGGTKIRRWLANGLPDLTFTASAESFIEAFAVGPNDEISCTSTFSVRWFSSDGAAEQTVSTMQPWLADKNCIRPRPDGSVYIGGGWDVIAYGIWKFSPTGQTFGDWLTNNIGNLTGPTGPAESLTGDTIPNFLRYAFAQTFSSSWRSPIQVTTDGSIHITFNPTASEATLKLFSTDNLNNPWPEAASKVAGQSAWTTSADFTLASPSAGQITLTPNTNAARFVLLSATPP